MKGAPAVRAGTTAELSDDLPGRLRSLILSPSVCRGLLVHRNKLFASVTALEPWSATVQSGWGWDGMRVVELIVTIRSCGQ
jgi:hypothetical protein